MDEQPSPQVLLTHLEWTIQRLKEILEREKTDYFRDAALQRFRFACEMALKTIRAFAASQRGPCESAEDCFSLSVKMQWLEKETHWQGLVNAFEQIQNNFDGATADAIYAQLPEYADCLGKLHHNLSGK